MFSKFVVAVCILIIIKGAYASRKTQIELMALYYPDSPHVPSAPPAAPTYNSVRERGDPLYVPDPYYPNAMKLYNMDNTHQSNAPKVPQTQVRSAVLVRSVPRASNTPQAAYDPQASYPHQASQMSYNSGDIPKLPMCSFERFYDYVEGSHYEPGDKYMRQYVPGLKCYFGFCVDKSFQHPLCPNIEYINGMELHKTRNSYYNSEGRLCECPYEMIMPCCVKSMPNSL